jgi:hypothetical protein
MLMYSAYLTCKVLLLMIVKNIFIVPSYIC